VTRDVLISSATSSGGGVRLDPILRFLHNLIDLVKMRQATTPSSRRGHGDDVASMA
jgi:hypothetical protein